MNWKQAILTLSSLCLFIIPGTLLGQNRNYRHFTRENGLLSNNVYSVHQDKLGYVWFCTELGISRFDGKAMRHFRKVDGLSDNEVFNLVEDSQGRMWFQTFNGKLSFLKDGVFYNESNAPWLSEIKGQGFMGLIKEDSWGRIWFSFASHGIYCLEGTVWTQYSFGGEHPDPDILPGLLSLQEISKDSLHVISAMGILKVSVRQKKLFFVKHEQINCGRGIWDREGNAIMSSTKRYLKWTPEKPKELLEIPGLPFMETANFFHDTQDEGMYVGIYADGLYLFPSGLPGKGKVVRVMDDCSPTSILRDSWGNRWVSTLDKGVFLFTLQDWENRILNIKDGLASDDCYGISKMSDGRLMIGHSEKKYTEIRGEEAAQVAFPASLFVSGGGKVRDFVTLPDGWELILLENYLLHKSPKGKAGAMRILIKGIYPWKDNTLLVSTRSQLLQWTKKQLAGFRYSYYDTYEDYELAKLKRHIYCSDLIEPGWVMLGGNGGLWSYKGDTAVPVLPDHPSLAEGVNHIEKGKGKQIWLAIKNIGLGLLEGDSLRLFRPAEGLCSENVSSITRDENNDIWITTPLGINRLRASDIEAGNFAFLHYDRSNGLPSLDCRKVMFDGDKMYVSTDKGVARISKSLLDQVETPPTLILESVQILDHDTLIQEHYDLTENQSRITLNYAMLEYRYPEHTHLEYRVSGIDSIWRRAPGNEISFAALEPGNYGVQVRLNGKNGLLSPENTLSFSVFSPFYKQWWFYLTGAVLLFLLLLAIAIFVVRRIRKQAGILVRLAKAEQIALQMQMNPHFIFNALNGIKGVYALGDQQRAGRYLSRFSQLLRGVLELSGKDMISISEELNLITSFLEINQLRFEDKLSYEVIVAEDVLAEQWGIPPLTLQPMVENSIFHGIAPKNGPGKVRVEIKKDGDYFICLVSDNGIGREAAAKQSRVRDHTSKATGITTQRISYFNEHKNGAKDFEIIDLYDKEGASTGTQVSIRLLIREMI